MEQNRRGGNGSDEVGVPEPETWPLTPGPSAGGLAGRPVENS